MKQERLEILVLARRATGPEKAAEAVATDLQRFAPTSLDVASWRAEIAVACARLAAIDARAELVRRIGVKSGATWAYLVDRALPALGLEVAASDTATLARLSGRDAWTAAIAGRILGIWQTGRPPSLGAACDGFAWRALGLTGRAKRCPPEIRALLLQRELQSDPGAPDRQLRLFVARELETGTELRAMRDALVRRWVLGRPLAAAAAFTDEVQRVAGEVTSGAFGDRKVFISSLWDQLRREPRWSSLSLVEFKARLMAAHRAGEIELVRADLVSAMDPHLVTASEIQGDGASFHFIVRGETS